MGAMGAIGLLARALGSRGLRKLHGLAQVPLVAWTIVGAVTVLWSWEPGLFDQAMAVGLLLMTGLVGYMCPRKGDPGWARAAHYALGAVVLAWYAVMAHRFGGLGDLGS